MPWLAFKSVHQRRWIESLDVTHDHGIHFRSRPRILVMRQVAAGDQQDLCRVARFRASPCDCPRDRIAERERRVARLVPHDERNDRDPRQQMRDERHLHFQRVLAAMRIRAFANFSAFGRNGRGELLVHGDATERRLPLARRPDRYAPERNEVRRSDQDDGAAVDRTRRFVGIRCDRARVSQPSVWSDDGARSGNVGGDLRRIDILVDFRGKAFGITRVPGTGHRRATDVHPTIVRYDAWMATELTKADVERIAALAHLELTEEEKDLFTAQLAGILHYAEQVQQVDTTGVPPMAHVGSERTERNDEPRPSIDRADALANAPDAALDAGLFRVPRVIGPA
jgi:aspartyl-tRNA(Asn)/glutamyl-tRNA(Gln) amidotransferase subunit C